MVEVTDCYKFRLHGSLSPLCIKPAFVSLLFCVSSSALDVKLNCVVVHYRGFLCKGTLENCAPNVGEKKRHHGAPLAGRITAKG